MDPLRVAAWLIRLLPRRAAGFLAWRIGGRVRRIPRVAGLVNGGRLVVDVGDYTQRTVFFFGEYEPETTRLVERLAHPGWTVLDAGANAGYFSVLAGGAPGARVVAFEPNPKLADQIAESLRLNPSMNITLERAACGEKAGVANLYLSPERLENSGLSTLRPDRFPDGETVEVPVVRLADYCTAHDIRPDLVKIDVEGLEGQVLRGAGWIIDDRVASWVLCEIAPHRGDAEEIIELMRERGYASYDIAPDGGLLPFKGLTSKWGNVCFTRR